MLESKIENDFVDLIRDYHLPSIAIKLVLFVGRGFPDRTILCNGKIFFIEFKQPGETLDPPQIKWKKLLTRLGFKVYVCTSTKKAYKIFLKEMDTT